MSSIIPPDFRYPYLEKLMMSSKKGVRAIIKTLFTVMTRIMLTGRFRVIKARLDDVFRLARWTRKAIEN